MFIGSALKNKGVQLLLDGVVDYLPNPSQINNEAHDQSNNEAKVALESRPDKPFVALAFKLEDGRFGQLTYMRIYQGKIAKGDFIVNCSAGQKKVKVPRLVRMHSNEMTDITEATAGDIVALFGVDCASGDTFTDGDVAYTMTSMHVPDAVISLAVAPKEKEGQVNFSKALNRFTKEDPTLRVHRDDESAQTIMSGMEASFTSTHLHRAHEARVQLRGRHRQAAGRVPRDHHPQGRLRLHPQRSRPAARVSSPASSATSSRSLRTRSSSTSSSTTPSVDRSRASSFRRVRRASRRR